MKPSSVIPFVFSPASASVSSCAPCGCDASQLSTTVLTVFESAHFGTVNATISTAKNTASPLSGYNGTPILSTTPSNPNSAQYISSASLPSLATGIPSTPLTLSSYTQPPIPVVTLSPSSSSASALIANFSITVGSTSAPRAGRYTLTSPTTRSSTLPPASSSIAAATPSSSSSFNSTSKAPQAIQPDDSVPPGAAVYTSPSGYQFNLTDFNAWIDSQRTSSLPCKYLKVTPGEYTYMPGPSPNPVSSPKKDKQIVFSQYLSGWTFDLRGCTFSYSITAENQQQRPEEAIYTNEAITILGGTFWINKYSELFSQARVIKVSHLDGGQTITAQVEQGYDINTWASANANLLLCTDDSYAGHFTRPDCDFSQTSQYKVTPNGTFTMWSAKPYTNIQEGLVLTLSRGVAQGLTLQSENSGGLVVKGLTTNGGIIQKSVSDNQTALFENILVVNGPEEDGLAPRVNGPVWSFDKPVGAASFGINATWPRIVGSRWQYTGSLADMKVLGDDTLPSPGM